MSTTGPADSQSPTFAPAALPTGSHEARAPATAGSVDPLLIQQTKNEIRAIVQEITMLSRASISAEQFYEEFLRRVVAALAAHGGAIWMANAEGDLERQYEINLPAEDLNEQDGSSARHALLVKNVMASGQATLVPPQSGGPGGEEAGNPTDFLLVLATLKVEQQPVGVIEILQRAGGGPTTQRGYLRFLVQMSELASEFLRNRRLRHLGDRQQLWNELESYIGRVHEHLDSQSVAFTLVNEGRRLVRCDRVSLAIARGRRHRIVAVSGLDTIDRRAAEVKLLGRLASAVSAARQPLWYRGPNDDLSPQIVRQLDPYLDQSHATVVGLLPLYGPPREPEHRSGRNASKRPVGTLIIEQLQGHAAEEGLTERAAIVASHGAAALANALEHEGLFLLPLWRMLGKARWVVQARTLPKTLLFAVVLLAAILLLVCVPADFDLAARGNLQPSVRRDVFAHLDGVVVDVPVKHEQEVVQGQILARLTSNSMDVALANVEGRLRTTQERIRSVRRASLNGQQEGLDEQLLELQQDEETLRREMSLLRQKEAQLFVRSDMDGQVVTWNVGSTLLRRPVQKGQLLMSIVDPNGAWELELNMPERRMGHIVQAARQFPAGLQVRFMLVSHPDLEFSGRVVEMHRLAEVRGEGGNTVSLRVAIDRAQLPELRSATSVTARVHCGRRSLGYVLFHDLIETVQKKILFWI